MQIESKSVNFIMALVKFLVKETLKAKTAK